MNAFFAERFGSGIYSGESLWIGHLGNLAILLGFVMALLSVIAYSISAKQDDERPWRKLGRISFGLHGLAVLSVFFLLFLMILGHHFEYYYAWRHSSLTLPLKYMVACFWEGQEGSFMLWQLWHVILGLFIIYRGGKWEAPVLAVIALIELVIGSMVLGVHFGELRIGSNPFVLLRDMMGSAPVFQLPDYLSYVTDGNGLNPLLQNYWMVIHPPVLFLGFASVAFPFAFAVAGLWKRDYSGWIAVALPWTLFSAAALGTGVLMGGAWAYESLSFGGFWAWDPVENASLVPWLVLVAGLHLMVAYQSSKHGLIAAFWFILGSFWLIVYSTFLTRSGILGETSVHSFTDLGLFWQLVFFLLFFIVLGLVALLIRYREIPRPDKEEDLWTREFWMFVGALFLLLSGAQITYTTSIPLINKLIGTNLAPPVELVDHYNRIQIFAAGIVAILTACIQFMRYRKAQTSHLLKDLGLPLILAVVVSLPFIFLFEFFRFDHVFLLIAAWYAILGNAHYLSSVLKGKLKLGGGSLSHIGFSLMLIAILISQGRQQVISINQEGIDYGKEFDDQSKRDNILLIRDQSKKMGPYTVTYTGVHSEPPNHYYKVHYERFAEDGRLLEEFDLNPNAQINPQMGLVSNPSTKHYWNRDLFTHVSSVPDNSSKKEEAWKLDTVTIDSSFFTGKYKVKLVRMLPNPAVDSIPYGPDKIAVGAELELTDNDMKTHRIMPVYIIDAIRRSFVGSWQARSKDEELRIRITRILPESESFVFSWKENEAEDDFIIMKAIVFPYINLLWFGSILMVIGFLLSMLQRSKRNRRNG